MRYLLIILTVLVLLVPVKTFAQYQLEFNDFLQDSTVWGGGIHGLAVDGEGKVWVHPWAQTDDFNGVETRPIYVYEEGPNGDEAAFSPIHQLTYDEEDYLVAGGGISRGLATDHNGDILASLGPVLYRIDHQTGDVLSRREFDAALAAVASTDNGDVVVGFAGGGQPLLLIDENFEDIQTVLEETDGSRTLEISGDGRYIYEINHAAREMYIHHSDEGVEGTYTPELVLEGVYMESSTMHPVTGHLWFSDNPPRVTPANENFGHVTWHAVDIEAVTGEGATVEESIVYSVQWAFWDGSEDVRSRGVAFSPDGKMAYFGMYNQSVVQVFSEYELSRPLLVGPDNGAQHIEPPVMLRWTQVENADDYKLELAYDEDFEHPVTIGGAEKKKSSDMVQDWGIYQEIPELASDTVFYWRVRAVSERLDLESEWSDTWSFDTFLKVPDPPVWQPEHEAEGVEITPLLVWEASERADRYDLQLADNSGFSDPIIDVAGIEATEFQIENELEKGVTYFWHVRAGNRSGYSDWSKTLSFTTEIPTDVDREDLPEKFALEQNYPNPFNPSTRIRYSVPEQAHVTIRVYNMLGEIVATLVNETHSSGRYEVSFDASGLSSGLLIYRIEAGDYMATRKMLFLK